MLSGHSKFLKKLDIFLLILFPILSVLLSLKFNANFLLSIFLFYGLPATWLSMRTPEKVIKTLLFSLVITIPLGIVLDYIGIMDGSWFVPVTVFSFRLFSVIPLEDLIWGFFFIYSTIIFYEHFLDKGKQQLVDKRMKYLVWPLIILLMIFGITFLMKPTALIIPFAYFWIGIIFFLFPPITFLSYFPRLLSKYVKTGSYFFIHALLFEITGLELGQWTFPGINFIGKVELLGYVLPFEEFFFWIILGSISVLSYFEFFDDDRK